MYIPNDFMYVVVVVVVLGNSIGNQCALFSVLPHSGLPSKSPLVKIVLHYLASSVVCGHPKVTNFSFCENANVTL